MSKIEYEYTNDATLPGLLSDLDFLETCISS